MGNDTKKFLNYFENFLKIEGPLQLGVNFHWKFDNWGLGNVTNEEDVDQVCPSSLDQVWICSAADLDSDFNEDSPTVMFGRKTSEAKMTKWKMKEDYMGLIMQEDFTMKK